MCTFSSLLIFNMIKHDRLGLSKYVVCVTEAFRTRDTSQSGTITIGFEDFLGVALSCSI